MSRARRARCRGRAAGITIAAAAVLAGCSGATMLPDWATTRLAPATDWAVVLFMRASAHLDSQAVADLAAIESADLAGSGVTVLALVDRTAGGSPSGWTGTRLYEFPHSVPVAVPVLGIDPAGPEVSLDMHDPGMLRTLLGFVEERYRPRRRALVLWGEGGGYHLAGFLSEALAEGGVDLLGLDMSFGATVEIAWEVRRSAGLLVASQGVVPAAGWDYEAALRRLANSDRTPRAFAEAIVATYAEASGGAPQATMSAVRLDRIEEVMHALNSFSSAVSAGITDATIREAVRGTIFYDVEDFYATPGDLAVDISDLAAVVSRDHGIAAAEAARLEEAVGEAVHPNHRGPADPRAHGISVHLIPLRSDGSAASSHHENYLNRPGEPSPLSFVAHSTWVPTLPAGPGLLYRLFYEPM